MNSWCIMCSVHCAAYCQKDNQEQRTEPARKTKPIKPKPVKSTNKAPKALTTKPKIKVAPAARAQTLLTQVFYMVHIHFLYQE